MPASSATPDAPFRPGPGGRVIVGYDGSPLAAAAVEWAAREAVARYAPLRIITASTPPDSTDFYDAGQRRREALADVAGRLAMRYPQLRIEQIATVLDPRDALLGDVEVDDLLVVGASTGGAAKRMLLGSVARTAARRSPCPVIIVREPPTGSSIEKIVVGIDGSSAAEAAIEWAASESRFHGADVDIVHAWNGEAGSEAQHVVDAAVAHCKRLTPNPVCGRLERGSAVDVLVAASRRADVLAIGSRGRSGFKTAIFGSVAIASAANACCATAVTHPQDPRPDGGVGTSPEARR